MFTLGLNVSTADALAGVFEFRITPTQAEITASSGLIDFDDEDLTTSGVITSGRFVGGRLDIDNLRLDGNTLSITNANGNLILQANGTGVIDAQSAMTSLGITATGTVGVTGQLNIDNLRLDANVLSSTNANGNITLTPNGSGLVELSSGFFPGTDSTHDIGKTGNVWNKLWIDGAIGGATQILITEVLTLRNSGFRDAARTLPVQAGDTLFWDAVSGTWLANHPDTEILHSELSGLTTGDAGHTQFAMLAGRAGGQTLQGGTASGEDLTLESTAHVSKGNIFLADDTVPVTTAAYAGSWSGTDLGDATHHFNDIFSKGEHKGLRVENFTVAGLPSASAQNPGRLAYATDEKSLYVDTGGAWLDITVGRFIADTVWNGTDVTKTVTVSASIVDARNAIWQLCDNANDYERIYTSLKPISATQVQIDVSPALPAGSYRLIGLE
jgi:hypothetical protein